MNHLTKYILPIIFFCCAIAYADRNLMSADTNRDGAISKAEFISEKEKKFAEFDSDSNGVLDADEQKEMMKKMHTSMKEKGYDDAEDDSSANM